MRIFTIVRWVPTAAHGIVYRAYLMFFAFKKVGFSVRNVELLMRGRSLRTCIIAHVRAYPHPRTLPRVRSSVAPSSVARRSHRRPSIDLTCNTPGRQITASDGKHGKVARMTVPPKTKDRHTGEQHTNAVHWRCIPTFRLRTAKMYTSKQFRTWSRSRRRISNFRNSPLRINCTHVFLEIA